MKTWKKLMVSLWIIAFAVLIGCGIGEVKEVKSASTDDKTIKLDEEITIDFSEDNKVSYSFNAEEGGYNFSFKQNNFATLNISIYQESQDDWPRIGYANLHSETCEYAFYCDKAAKYRIELEGYFRQEEITAPTRGILQKSDKAGIYNGLQYRITSAVHQDGTTSTTGTIIGYVGDAKELTVPSKINGYSIDAIESMRGNTYYNDTLEKLYIEEGITEFGTNDVCYDFRKLRYVELPSTMGSTGFSRNPFRFCVNLDIRFPNGSEHYKYENNSLIQMSPNGMETLIGYYGDPNTTEYQVPAGVNQIGDWSFYLQNSLLATVKLPDSLDRVHSTAFCSFDDSFSLKKIIAENPAMYIYKDSFGWREKPVVYSKSGGYLETLCNEHGLEFVGEGEMPKVYPMTENEVTKGYRYKDGDFHYSFAPDESGIYKIYSEYSGTGITSESGYFKIYDEQGEEAVGGFDQSGWHWICKLESGKVYEIIGVVNSSEFAIQAGVISHGICKSDPKDHYDIPGINPETPPVPSYNGYEYSVKDDGTVEITRYSGSETELKIPGEIEGKKVTEIGNRTFSNCSSLTKISIPDSVTSIQREAFSACNSLTNITVADSNTVYDSRENCNAIIFTNTNTLVSGCKNTIIPDSVTSIGSRAFSNCHSLTEINIPDSVTDIMGFAFYDCDSLASINIPDSVTSIGDCAFDYCSSLTSITVTGSNTVYDSRENCNAIIKTNTNTLLTGCKNTLIPDSVTDIGYGSFSGCESLTEITIPDGVTSIGAKAFDSCSSLTKITIPDSVTRIGDSAFYRCSSLTQITIPDSVTSIGSYVFTSCPDDLVIQTPKDSYADTYAQKNEIAVKYIEKPALTPDTTPIPSIVPSTTPGQTPSAKPTGKPDVTPTADPDTTPAPSTSPGENPGETPSATPGQTPDAEPSQAPDASATPAQSPAPSTPAPAATPAAGQPQTQQPPVQVQNPPQVQSAPGNSSISSVSPGEPSTASMAVKGGLKLTAGKKKLTLKWQKVANASGYEIQVSQKKNFKGAKKLSMKKSKKSHILKKLKSGKVYYVRIRAYTKSGGKKVYGKWVTAKKKVK